jgi:hypothetical protein
MTLTRGHIRRLWHPEPGGPCAIPSRAGHSLSAAEMRRRMPVEFWREVSERLAAEAPDTLLLAEAFWRTEGYFLRALGVHRVYNPAFMHLLRDEDNAGFQRLLREAHASDPRLLQRLVNYLSNPDEASAAVQFGRGDKYFGLCILQATLPGVPLFAHGQVEGLEEQYGMEYARPRRDEAPDAELVRRHERQVFPLLRRRGLFAGVDRFVPHEALDPRGRVNEDVFAFSNRRGDARRLVVYQNRGDRVRCLVRPAAGGAHGSPASALGLRGGGGVRCGDAVSGSVRRFSRRALEEGLPLELGPYQAMVLQGWRRDDG